MGDPAPGGPGSSVSKGFSMIVFILRRLLHTIPVLFGVTIVVFLSLQLVPGDVAQTLLGFSATAERVAALRRDLGLDKPIYVQYATWLWKLVQGDLGRSIAMRVPVASVLGIKFINSLILSGASLLIVIVGSFFLGTISAANFRKSFDRFTVFFTLFIAALPVFWLGIVLLYVFRCQNKSLSPIGDVQHGQSWRNS